MGITHRQSLCELPLVRKTCAWENDGLYLLDAAELPQWVPALDIIP